jgi:vacuolar protein sorting-associated protein 26
LISENSLQIIFSFSEMLNDRATIHEFINENKSLSFPGELTESTTLDFAFPAVDKPYESYIGINVKLRWTSSS